MQILGPHPYPENDPNNSTWSIDVIRVRTRNVAQVQVTNPNPNTNMRSNANMNADECGHANPDTDTYANRFNGYTNANKNANRYPRANTNMSTMLIQRRMSTHVNTWMRMRFPNANTNTIPNKDNNTDAKRTRMQIHSSILRKHKQIRLRTHMWALVFIRKLNQMLLMPRFQAKQRMSEG